MCTALYVRYQIDNSVVRNPYAVWQQGGKPDYPSYTLLQQMRDAAVSGEDTHTHAHMHTNTHTCTQVHTHAQTHAHTHMHKHMHTQTPAYLYVVLL